MRQKAESRKKISRTNRRRKQGRAAWESREPCVGEGGDREAGTCEGPMGYIWLAGVGWAGWQVGKDQDSRQYKWRVSQWDHGSWRIAGIIPESAQHSSQDPCTTGEDKFPISMAEYLSSYHSLLLILFFVHITCFWHRTNVLFHFIQPGGLPPWSGFSRNFLVLPRRGWVSVRSSFRNAFQMEDGGIFLRKSQASTMAGWSPRRKMSQHHEGSQGNVKAVSQNCGLSCTHSCEGNPVHTIMHSQICAQLILKCVGS